MKFEEFNKILTDNIADNAIKRKIWSLIQRGLKDTGYYDLSTFAGIPADYTGKAFNDYMGYTSVPKWLEIAEKEIGVKEFSGEADNPDVVKYLRSVNDLSKFAQQNDETSWCSAFVNWCVEQSGRKGTNSAAARSWLTWGMKLEEPVPGCVTVLWRESADSWKGHVAFFVGKKLGLVRLLGGNQNDAVSIKSFPEYRVIGYRI